LFFIQAFVAITIIPNKNKLGFHDKATDSFVIFANKKYARVNKEVIKSYKELISPKKITNKPVE